MRTMIAFAILELLDYLKVHEIKRSEGAEKVTMFFMCAGLVFSLLQDLKELFR